MGDRVQECEGGGAGEASGAEGGGQGVGRAGELTESAVGETVYTCSYLL